MDCMCIPGGCHAIPQTQNRAKGINCFTVQTPYGHQKKCKMCVEAYKSIHVSGDIFPSSGEIFKMVVLNFGRKIILRP